MKINNFILIVILVVLLAILINYPSENLIMTMIRSILGILFIIFLPGYLFVDILFKKNHDNLGKLEALVISIGFSVSLVILISMAVYLAGLEIEVVNIMNILLITTSVIAIANLFTKASGRETKSKWDKDKLFFYLHLFLLIAIVFVLIYLSIITPSREEYVELYWKTTEVKNIQNYSDIECEIENCSLSGIYKVGDLTLNNEYYKIMITDLDESGEYDAFCIDLDRDDKYCENVEGPYRYYETFFIDSSAFSSLYFDENQIIFINYPDYVYIENFTVSFVVKSLYSTNLNFNIRVLVNDTLQHDELLELYPGEEILKKVNISLPTENRYKVKVVVSSEVYDEGAYIDFWVDRKI